MNSKITDFIALVERYQIPKFRKDLLDDLAIATNHQISKAGRAALTFVCTHNARRSQLAQVWFAIAAHHRGIDVDSYSGGAEVTECNPAVVRALERIGCVVETISTGDNPKYKVHFNDSAKPVILYSKAFDSSENPQEEFIAVLVCSDAEEACPHVPGTAFRMLLSYQDPKPYDGTRLEESVYDYRSLQIAAEMFYLTSKLNS